MPRRLEGIWKNGLPSRLGMECNKRGVKNGKFAIFFELYGRGSCVMIKKNGNCEDTEQLQML